MNYVERYIRNYRKHWKFTIFFSLKASDDYKIRSLQQFYFFISCCACSIVSFFMSSLNFYEQSYLGN
jgi:hypothetical protein